MCAAPLFYTTCYSEECLKLEEEDARLQLQRGKFKVDMRKQLHAMHDLTIKTPLRVSVQQIHKEN